MVKLLFFPLIYSLGFLIWNFSCDINAIGSSISAEVDSDPGIKNAANFSHHRTKRAFTLLVPVDDDESSDEHHKTKRCWRARPVQNLRIPLYPGESDNRIYRATGSGQRTRPDGKNIEGITKYPRGAMKRLNFKKNQERSVDQSEEDSWNSDETLNEKVAKIRLVPLKNPRDNLKEFLDIKTAGIRGKASDIESEEDGEDVILRKIKNHLNSDDYNVLALVGKRAGHYPSNNRRKLICYCRDVSCSGGDCEKMMYRPCSTCRNPRPGSAGRTYSKSCSDYGGDSYKSQKMRLADEKVPLNVRYPMTKNQFVDHPMDKNDLQSKGIQETSSPVDSGLNKVELRTSEHNRIEDRGGHFFHDTPRIVLANPNNGMNQYRILHIPVSSKSPVENGISGSSRPAGSYRPASGWPMTNQYRPGIVRFSPNPPAYNQRATNPYHPSIGNPGPIVPSADQGIVHCRPPGSRTHPFLGAARPEITTGPSPIVKGAFYGGHQSSNGFRLNTPSGVRPKAFPQQQNIRVPFGRLDYPATTQASASSTLLEDDENESIEGHFEAEDHDARKEYNLGYLRNLGRNSYDDYGDESMENHLTAAAYGDDDDENETYLNMIKGGGSLR